MAVASYNSHPFLNSALLILIVCLFQTWEEKIKFSWKSLSRVKLWSEFLSIMWLNFQVIRSIFECHNMLKIWWFVRILTLKPTQNTIIIKFLDYIDSQWYFVSKFQEKILDYCYNRKFSPIKTCVKVRQIKPAKQRTPNNSVTNTWFWLIYKNSFIPPNWLMYRKSQIIW
jgi:hypothetical protein